MKKVPMLIPVLVLAVLTFCGILVYAYVESKKANPQMLDEKGNLKESSLRVPICVHRLTCFSVPIGGQGLSVPRA
jgi:hypothetical protein